MFPLVQMFGQSNYTRSFTVSAQLPTVTDGTNIYIGASYTVTPAGGTNPVVPLTPNNYLIKFADSSYPWRISVPLSATVQNALQLTSTNSGLPLFSYVPPTSLLTLGKGTVGANGSAAIWMLGVDGSGEVTTNPVPTGGGSEGGYWGTTSFATNAQFAVDAIYATNAGTAASLSGSISPSHITGLGSAALTSASAYDAAGSAQAATNTIAAPALVGTLPLSALPAVVLTNGQPAVTFGGLSLTNATSLNVKGQIVDNYAQNDNFLQIDDGNGNMIFSTYADIIAYGPLVAAGGIQANTAGTATVSIFPSVNGGGGDNPLVLANGIIGNAGGLTNVNGAAIVGALTNSTTGAAAYATNAGTAASLSGNITPGQVTGLVAGLTATNTPTTGQVLQYNGGTNVWASTINSNVVYASVGVVSQPWVPTNCLLQSDGLWFTNCWIGMAITNTVTCTNANFSSVMVGKQILVQNAFTAQQSNSLYVESLYATVTNVPNGNQVQFSPGTSLASSLTTPYQTSVFIATDDSTNLQNLIYWCYSNSIHRIVFSRATGIGGALQDTNNWNCLIRLPTVAGLIDSFVFKFEGDNGPDEGASVGLVSEGQPFNTPTTLGAWLVVMNTGGTNSYQAANTSLYQSFLCGGTNGVPGTSDSFNNVTPVFENLGIRLPGNARLGAIEAKYCNSIKMYNVTVDDGWGSYAGPDITQDPHTFGVEGPNNGNNAAGGDIIQASRIVGFYVGLIAYEHMFVNDVALFNCVYGAQVSGYHGVTMIHPRFQSCLFGIQSEGQTSVTILDADFEHDKYPVWYTTYNDDIDDQQNRMSGMIEYAVYNSGAGSTANYTNLVVKGGLNLIKIPAIWNTPWRNAYTASAVGQYYTNYVGNGNMLLTANFANESTPGWYGGSTNPPTFAQWTTNLPAVSGFMAIPSNANAPLSNDFVNCFGNIATNAATTNVIGPVTVGAHVMWYWTTNGATINSAQTAP